jgi:hypothetical protein
MTAWIWAGLVETRPEGGGFIGLLAGSGAGGYWQLAPRPGGGANAGNGGTVFAAGVFDPGTDPGLVGTLARLGVVDVAAVVGP